MNIKMKNQNFYNITAASIDRYLQLNNWVRDYKFPNKNLMVFFNGIGGAPEKIAIPASEEFHGFYSVLDGIIETISKLEGRSENELIKDINATFIDRMEFRLISENTSDGKIPIDYASNCIDGLKDLILYAICSEISPGPVCLRASDAAKTNLSNYKLAQTEKGSFVLNIDTQVVNEKSEKLPLPGIDLIQPFEHRVIKRIGTAINQIDSIARDECQVTKVADIAYKEGINANMCEALSKLRPLSYDDRIFATIRYASSITHKTGYVSSVEMRVNHFDIIDELAKIYRDKVVTETETITGYIYSLTKKNDVDGELHKIKLLANINGTFRTVEVNLSDEKYRMACDAHRDEVAVTVSGELDMSGRQWILRDITNFSVD